MKHKISFEQFKIADIKSWLSEDSKFSLPVMQRGFVWKVAQIECLWDSIFRGYPIGSLMLAKTGDKYMLLDGQQRITSIALGFYNPWKSQVEQIGNLKKLPVIWIDVSDDSALQKPNSYRYAFRVVTQSHPWGYQYSQNNSILSVTNRRAANEQFKRLFNQTIYTRLLPEQRRPYDACLPIPLCFLIEAAQESSQESFKSKVVYLCRKYKISSFETIGLKRLGKDYYEFIKETDFTTFYDTIKEIVLQTEISATILTHAHLIDKEDKTQEDPTLFVRLNSQGTRIEGEELMYSMYKAVCPEVKDLVETIGLGIIAPSRIISLVSRLVLSMADKRFVSSVNLALFKSRIIGNEANLKKMRELIDNSNNCPIKILIEQSLDILRFNDVPDVIIKKFILDKPNGLLLLIYWLINNANIEMNVDKETARHICARLYRNYWFGDVDHLAQSRWNRILEKDFWIIDEVNNEKIWEHPLIAPSVLEEFLLSRLNDTEENHSISPENDVIWRVWSNCLVRNTDWSELDFNQKVLDGWLSFLGRLMSSYHKSLILLAQRDFINRTFKEFNQIEDLEDSNTPWDWDHIYPLSWVYHQQHIDPRMKKWEYRLGNLRAMSLTDNRSENNNLSPADRFSEPNRDYFICNNDYEFWKLLDNEHRNIKEEDTESVLNHAKAIIIRTVNIYRNFLEMFGLYNAE